jgi:tetratricopeptide (TPR) repeat protein
MKRVSSCAWKLLKYAFPSCHGGPVPVLRAPSLLLVTLALILTGRAAPGQEQKPDPANPSASSDKTQKRATAHDSIVVGAHLTPEEKEDGRINDAYQPLYHLKAPGDCQQIRDLDEKQIIPMAEQSNFEVTRNKFLYLANRDIASCEMSSGRYKEAEERYQRMFDFIKVWPGTDDSDYPLNFRLIGQARLAQMRWKEAQEPLEKSVATYGQEIERALHSDSKTTRESSKLLKMSDAMARQLLAVAYFRDDRQSEAMEILEQAYQEAIQSSATPKQIQTIIDSGRAASTALGDEGAKKKWDSRTPPSS